MPSSALLSSPMPMANLVSVTLTSSWRIYSFCSPDKPLLLKLIFIFHSTNRDDDSRLEVMLYCSALLQCWGNVSKCIIDFFESVLQVLCREPSWNTIKRLWSGANVTFPNHHLLLLAPALDISLVLDSAPIQCMRAKRFSTQWKWELIETSFGNFCW